jgi:cytochrome c oxidase subunit II
VRIGVRRVVAALLPASLLLAACGSFGSAQPPVLYPGNDGQFAQFNSNGQQIYFTATDKAGQRIAYSGGLASGGMMMGEYLACADCHGADAGGGVHYIHMQSVEAPAIYYDALVQMLQEDLGGTPQPAGYSLTDFRQAVVEGKDAAGDSLEEIMPRWQMGDADLADLLDFLRTLP